MDILTIYTHDSKAITAPPLNSTIHKSPQHPLSLFPLCCVFTSRSLATPYNSGGSSASRTHVHCSQPPFYNLLKLTTQKVTLRLTVGQSVALGVELHLGLMTRYLLLFDSYDLVFVGRPF
jgi:hypothetical protein